MSGRRSRDKGARGERELAKVLDGRRTGQMQSQDGAPEADVAWAVGLFVECKRAERICIEAWCRQAEAACGDEVPVVVWRRNRQPWRITLRLEDFVALTQGRMDGWALHKGDAQDVE